MFDQLRPKLSFANLISLLALFVALGGSAYALTRGEVKSKHIAANAVKTKQIKDSAVKTPKIANNAVTAAKLAGGLGGQAGPQGPQGPQGGQGPTGPAGSALAYARVSGATGSSTVDGTVSQGITRTVNANPGVYCLDYTGGVAKNVLLTIDGSQATQNDRGFASAVPATLTAAGCPSGSDILVQTYTNATPANTAFYIAVIA